MGRQSIRSGPQSWSGWRLALVLGCLLFLWLGQTAAQGVCTLSLSAKASRRTVKPKSKLKVGVTWTNRGGDPFVNGVLRLQLPKNTRFKSAKTTKVRRGSQGTYNATSGVVEWSGLAVRPRSSLSFIIKVRCPSCYPGPTLRFNAVAFIPDPTDLALAPLCYEEDTVIVVR